MKRKNMSHEEQEFIKNYKADAYERPSVTADIVVFTLDDDDDLNILLIMRKGFPYKDHWAIPGGFLEVGKESIDDTARRELYEETGLDIDNIYLKQLYTFGKPDRDPRTHVISVAYTALIPKSQLTISAGDDASDARLFKIKYDVNGMLFVNDTISLTESQLAFDHNEIIRTAITRIRGRIDYEPDAFNLLKDKSEFTIYELKRIYESIKNTTLDTANFRKSFIRSYVNSGLVVDLNRKRAETGKKATELYSYVGA
ncbi:MAG: NUDIX hydrolase [Lachnospiraceae bacterium]|nr:NUDIX hydrolase [Lachnospiraceae bacterium]